MSYKVKWAIEGTKYKYLVVSENTLHPFDLFHAFRNTANGLSSHHCLKGHPGHDYRTWKWWPKGLPTKVRKMHDHDFWDSEDVHEAIEQLFDYLDALSPEGYYFGAAEGDGACFGWWPIQNEM